MLEAARLDKQAQLNGGWLDLILLNTLDQTVPLVVLKIKIHIALWRPLLARNEVRTSVDGAVIKDVQKALACIGNFGELNTYTGNMRKFLLREDICLHIPKIF